MRRIEVTDNAARFVEALRNSEELNRRKAALCDVLCDVITSADVNGIYGKALIERLMAVVDAVELVDELSRAKDNVL